MSEGLTKGIYGCRAAKMRPLIAYLYACQIIDIIAKFVECLQVLCFQRSTYGGV